MTKSLSSFVRRALVQQFAYARSEVRVQRRASVQQWRSLEQWRGLLSAAWSGATRLSGCGTVTSTAEAPTGVRPMLLYAIQSCCAVFGSGVDSSLVYERGSYTVSKRANACCRHGKKYP